MARPPVLQAVLPRVDPSVATVAVGVVLAALLAAVVVVTVGRSVERSRERRRRDAVREDLRGGLLERLYGPDDPGWAAWVADLSGRERAVLESLLDSYLRELEGSDARRLAELGAALGIDERARERLATAGYYGRLRALTWLALLRDPPDVETLEAHCTGTPRERAAAARTLYEGDHPDVATVGVDLLLRDSPGAFSVFGVDTLYRVAYGDPAHLFERAAADYDGWGPALRQQVLLVSRHVNTVVGDADLSWVVGALSAPEERTRVEAARALGGYGWRSSVRERVDVDALLADPSPAVRASAYRMLGEWGDGEAVDALLAGAGTEPDPRARVAAAEALVAHRDGTDTPASLADAWSWAAEHAAFDRRARGVSEGD